MRQLPSTEPKFAGHDPAVCSDTAPATVLAQSALHLTRAAIARWTGSARPGTTPVRELPRISPQARWLTQVQAGLDTWIADGGFTQANLHDMVPLPVKHSCTTPSQLANRDASACID